MWAELREHFASPSETWNLLHYKNCGKIENFVQLISTITKLYPWTYEVVGYKYEVFIKSNYCADKLPLTHFAKIVEYRLHGRIRRQNDVIRPLQIIRLVVVPCSQHAFRGTLEPFRRGDHSGQRPFPRAELDADAVVEDHRDTVDYRLVPRVNCSVCKFKNIFFFSS